MKTRTDHDEFFRRVQVYASEGKTILECAKAEKISVPSFKNQLLKSAIQLQLKIPKFGIRSGNQPNEFIEIVRKTGRAGKGKNLRIPHRLLVKMNWNPGDQISIHIRGKKVILQNLTSDLETSNATQPSQS